jgi:hypothetical protein
MKCRFLMVLILVSLYSFGQMNNKGTNGKNKYTNKVSFATEGKKRNIDNQFSITIIHEHDTIRAKVKSHEFVVPKLSNSIEYIVTFKYRQYTLSFRPVPRAWLIPDEDVTWEFGIDNKPFKESLDLIPENQTKADSAICQLQYLRLDPSISDPGRLFVNKIDCDKLKKH